MVDELHRLRGGPSVGQRPGGVGTMRVTAVCEDPADVLDRCVEAMVAILAIDSTDWPTLASWSQMMPSWFVRACAPTSSPAEEKQWLRWWRGLDPAGREAAERTRPWSLESWLQWMRPEERTWFWWDARTAPQRLHLDVEVAEWPAPLGSLRWLLTAAGAQAVDVE